LAELESDARPRKIAFQMPARLAVGLGLESGLETSRLISFAPSETIFGIWVSRAWLQEGSQTSLQRKK